MTDRVEINPDKYKMSFHVHTDDTTDAFIVSGSTPTTQFAQFELPLKLSSSAAGGSALEIFGGAPHITSSGNYSGSSTSTITIGGALTAGAGTLTSLNVSSHITASGNISASGNAYADAFYLQGDENSGINHNLNNDLFIKHNVNGKFVRFIGRDSGGTTNIGATIDYLKSSVILGDPTTPFNVTASSNIAAGGYLYLSSSKGHITASGNISASGTGSFTELQVNRYIRHIGDNDTHIEFLINKIQLHAGNIPFITFDKDASTPYPLTVNNGGNQINFRVQDSNSDLLLKTDSQAYKVNLYHAGNQKLETAVGGINVTGNITASGNLKVDGSQVDFTNLPTSDPSVAGRLWNSASYVKISAG